MATIGIDFGTTNSRMAIVKDGVPTMLPNLDGFETTPSTVGLLRGGEWSAGEAKPPIALGHVWIGSPKRLLGLGTVEAAGKEYSPPEIAAKLLGQLKTEAEEHLEETVDAAVIAIPASFSHDQRREIREAARLAGLDVQRLIHDPTATALAYGLDLEPEQTLPGRRLRRRQPEHRRAPARRRRVRRQVARGRRPARRRRLRSRGRRVAAGLVHAARGDRPDADLLAVARVHEAAEKARIELSSTAVTDISLPFITAEADGGPKHLSERLTRAKLEELTGGLVDRIEGPLQQALDDARDRDTAKIDHVLFVGGMSRMPAVRAKVERLTGQAPRRGPDTDEAVALGAAIEAGVLTKAILDVLVLDVTPFTLGIETEGGAMTKVIQRGTTIPTRKSEVFSTVHDNQNSVAIHVLQGEGEQVPDNVSLGRFLLTRIRPAPHGIPQIEVGFDIDVDGIVNVSAKDLGTGEEQRIEATAEPSQPPAPTPSGVALASREPPTRRLSTRKR